VLRHSFSNLIIHTQDYNEQLHIQLSQIASIKELRQTQYKKLTHLSKNKKSHYVF